MNRQPVRHDNELAAGSVMAGFPAQGRWARDLLACPRCWGGLDDQGERYTCASCGGSYPILFGIADFRMRSDRYLTLEEEREKASRLYEFGKNASFEEMVTYYYSITDDVPNALAVRYQANIHNAPKLSAGIVGRLGPDPKTDVLLDLGCGAGGLLVAACGRYRRLIGVDIALRWLVICAKRLMESNVQAVLVCADAQALPFVGGNFNHVVAMDLIEHVRSPRDALVEIRRQFKPEGRLWLSASNRYCIGPHPLTRIWGIGFFPKAVRSAILCWVRGTDSLRFVNLLSFRSVSQLCEAAGFRLIQAAPRRTGGIDVSKYPWHDRILIGVYRALSEMPVFRHLLLWIGPAFEMVFAVAKLAPSAEHAPGTGVAGPEEGG